MSHAQVELQSHQWKHQKDVQKNLFKINNKATRTTSDFPYYFGVSNVVFEQVNADWVCKSWSHLNDLYLT